jgi:hypothetical protein
VNVRTGTSTLIAVLSTLAVLSSCSSDKPLPIQFWLAPDGDEEHLKLAGEMPTPY